MRPESTPCIDLADRNARQVRWIDQDQLHGQKNAILLDWAEVMMLRPGRRSGKTRGCHFSSRRPYVFGLAKIGSASFARFYAAEELRNDGCLGRKTLARAEPLTSGDLQMRLRHVRTQMPCATASRPAQQHRIMRIICESAPTLSFLSRPARLQRPSGRRLGDNCYAGSR